MVEGGGGAAEPRTRADAAADRCRWTPERSGPVAYGGRRMSTRKLILLALLCGVAILAAFVIQMVQLLGNK
jgi:hypothetical protein